MKEEHLVGLAEANAVEIDVHRYRAAAKVWVSKPEEQQALNRASILFEKTGKAFRKAPGSSSKRASTPKRVTASIDRSNSPLLAEDTWVAAIRKELYKALCKRSAKYKKAVRALTQNSQLLITLVATAVASKIGFGVGVVAALVASMLRFLLKLGIGAFCGRMNVES